MSTERETTRVVRSWLEEGVTALPDRILDAVLDQVPATPQRRPLWPFGRFAEMSSYARLGSVAAILIVIVAIGMLVVLGGVGGQATASPSPTTGALATETPAATSESAAGALLPGEFTACVPPNTEFKVGTYTQAAADGATVKQQRGYTWKGTISSTDPRFTGTDYYSWDGDSYTLESGQPGQEVSAETHRIETDEGAWEGSGVALSFPDDSLYASPLVLTGEGAYAGLTAVIALVDGSCFFNYRGIVTDVPDAPVPYTGP